MEVLEQAHLPLTRFSDEEDLFRQSVASFAKEQIGPHVSEMDEKAKFKPEILEAFFELGLMGIEIPESHGGAGSTFFMSILAVEELSRVDA